MQRDSNKGSILNRLPITLVAPLLVGLPVLVIGVWLSTMWNRQSQQAVTTLADQNIAQLHQMAETKISSVLSVPMRVCEVNSHFVTSGALPPDELSTWQDTLVHEFQTFDMLSAISWGSANGRAVWVSRYSDDDIFWAIKNDPSAEEMSEFRIHADGSVADSPTSSFAFDLFSRPWYQAPQRAGSPTWSEPFVWVGGKDSEAMTLGISYGIPVHDSTGAMLGIIDADYSLNDLSGFLGSVEIGKSGVAALTTADGRLLATSNSTPIMTASGARLAAHESGSHLIASAANLVEQDTINPSDRSVIEIEGAAHYVRVSQVGEQLGLDWRLLTVVPEQDFLGEIESGFQRSWVVSLLGMALAVVLGLVAARWLVAPLVTLVAAVQRIGEGDLETRIAMSHAPEYNKLANEINVMTEGLQDRLRMRQSLELAMEVQKNLLPADPPTIARLDMAGHSTYCDETGGDYYDFLDLSTDDNDTAVIAVGDVVGHGVAAAMLMATARGILRSRCSVTGTLADFLVHLNEMLVEDTRGERFMTMLLLTLTPQRNELRWASAGHGPPIIYNANDDTFLELDGGGLPLGLFGEQEYDEYLQADVKPGHIIVAATDGLWETMAEDGTAFGMERLYQLLRDNADRTADEISELIGQALATFRGDLGQDDDLTFVIAKVL